MNQLDQLCELDPEHFICEHGVYWFKYGPLVPLSKGITWEIAGWMLTQMQERHASILERTGQAPTIEEYGALQGALSKMLYAASPELITEGYIEWLQSKPVDAPAATLGTVTDQSPQQPKETGQAPAITYETDH